MRLRSNVVRARARLASLSVVALMSASLVVLSASSGRRVDDRGGECGGNRAATQGSGSRLQGRARAADVQPERAHELRLRRSGSVLREPVAGGQGQRRRDRARCDGYRREGRLLRAERGDGERQKSPRAARPRPTGGRAGARPSKTSSTTSTPCTSTRSRPTAPTRRGGESRYTSSSPRPGPDEAAQRADALEVIGRKPFIVIDAGNVVSGSPSVRGDDRGEEDHRRRVPPRTPRTPRGSARTGGCRARTPTPPRTSPRASSAAPCRVRRRSGRVTSAMTSKTRAFGAVYPASGLDIDGFKRL